MSEPLAKPNGRRARPRVSALVALTLLEALREHDLPGETLESEDTQVTLPRRLGLSDVVDQQIRRYRKEVRKGGRMSDDEVADLVRLVIRRPDREELFFRVGRNLADTDPRPGPLRRVLPGPAAFALARRAVRKRLRWLFGRRVGGFGPGPFTLQGRALVFIQTDPGGDACQLLSGLCQAALDAYSRKGVRLVHSLCEARGDEVCRWTVLAEEKVADQEGVTDFILNPEPG